MIISVVTNFSLSMLRRRMLLYMDQNDFSFTVSLDLTYHDTFILYSFGFKNTFNDSIKLKVYQNEIQFLQCSRKATECLSILNTSKHIFQTSHSNLRHLFKVSKYRSYNFIHFFNQSDSTTLNFNNLSQLHTVLPCCLTCLLNFQDPA